jgi:hypothetical protein
MTTISHLREAKALLSANWGAEAHKLIEITIYSLLDVEHRRQAGMILSSWAVRWRGKRVPSR